MEPSLIIGGCPYNTKEPIGASRIAGRTSKSSSPLITSTDIGSESFFYVFFF